MNRPPGRLRHPDTGVNHENPRPRVDLQIRFIDGTWYVFRGTGIPGERRRGDAIDHATAQLITELAGTITADVVASNYRGWVEAKLAWATEEARRARQQAEAAVLDARREVRSVRRPLRARS